MDGMIFLIALARCIAGHCEFSYPAPDMPYADERACREDAKLFDFYLDGRYWTEVTCVEVPRDWVGRPVPKRW